jgi:hypothetical protein
MNIDENIAFIKGYLKKLGWTLDNQDEVFEYYINITNSKISFPLVKKDLDYVITLKHTLEKAAALSPDLAKHPVFKSLISQCQNLVYRYSKNKKSWILLEPNCRYSINEIPDIYIPKYDIFENIIKDSH